MAIRRPEHREGRGTSTSPPAASARQHEAPDGLVTPRGYQDVAEEGLARALGWFGIGLGVGEALAPRALARLIGVPPRPLLVRALGVREITSGIGILAQPMPRPWMWSRVAGDVVDLALLGLALRGAGVRRGRVAAAGAAVDAVMLLDLACAQWLSSRPRARSRHATDAAIGVVSSIAINRPPDELYRFWRDLENLPRFMKHLQSVRTVDDRRSHWVARAPAGATVEWDAEITDDTPGERIAWHALPGASVEHAGSVRFEGVPGRRETLVAVELRYRPPAGVVGAAVARLFGEEPAQQIADDLRRLKQVIETGEIATNAGPSARGGRP